LSKPYYSILPRVFVVFLDSRDSSTTGICSTLESTEKPVHPTEPLPRQQSSIALRLTSASSPESFIRSICTTSRRRRLDVDTARIIIRAQATCASSPLALPMCVSSKSWCLRLHAYHSMHAFNRQIHRRRASPISHRHSALEVDAILATPK
jgi:hypothetical protein